MNPSSRDRSLGASTGSSCARGSSKNAQTALWTRRLGCRGGPGRDRRARAPRPTARATRSASASGVTDRNVRVMSAKQALSKSLGEEVAEDGVVVVDPAAALVVAVGRLGPVRDDHVVAAAAELRERLPRRRRGGARRSAARRRRGGRRRRAPSARAARRSRPCPPRPPPARRGSRRAPKSDLRRRRSSKNRWSTTSSIAVRPQPVADPEREARGDDRPLDPERAPPSARTAPGRPRRRRARRPEAGRAGRSRPARARSSARGARPIALDAPDDRDAPAADLCVEERVADVDRNLVPELRETERVADQEDIWHEG